MAAVAASQDIQSDLVPAIATAFCSGYSETGGTCGALNGAVMSVSMVLGRHTNQDPRDLVYSKTQFLVHTFQAEFQATRCPELLQLDLRSPGASAEYQARGLNKQCENYIRQISRVAAELLQQA